MKRVARFGSLVIIVVALGGALGCGNEAPGAGAIPSGAEQAATFGPLHTTGRWIRDKDHRTVILRGINVGSRSKLPPFLPFDHTSSLDQLVQWGLNSVRLLFTWEGVEPSEGHYDEGYLDRLAAIVEACEARGLMVILDSHQDIYARNFCGDGFPAWSVHPDYRDETCPGPLHLWPLSYVTSAGVIRSFDRFWDDPGLRAAYIRMMVHVADRLASYPAVVGMDLLNEPFDLSYFLFDGSFEQNSLVPFYRDLIAALRERRPDLTIFYGTTGLFSVGFPTFLGPVGMPNLVFAAHWYDLFSLLSGVRSDTSALRRRLEEMAELASLWDVPVWIGEYGVPTNRTDTIDSLADQIDLLEEYLFGSAIWTYNPTEVDWNEENTSLVYPGGAEKPHVNILVRPYPSRVAGTPTRFAYQKEAGVLELSFVADPDARGPTEIVLPYRTYPAGIEVEAPDGVWQWDERRRVLLYEAPGDGLVHTIRVGPTSPSLTPR